MNAYDKGNVVEISAEWTDAVTGDFVDPTTVQARVKDPLGVTVTYIVTAGQIVRDELGKFHMDLEPEIQGIWSYEWIGTGANKGAKQNAFKINESQFD